MSSSAPKPPVPIKDQCTVIHDDTLYVYSPDAFLSLDLKTNATWTTLPNGIGVKGAVCVKGTNEGKSTGDALWIVGGTANDTNADYPGLQKFSFDDKKWDSISPLTTITKNRRNHGAAFLDDTSQILVYAGSQQDPETPSIETFLIQITKPFNVLSASGNNTPVIAPVLLPWDSGSAIAFGGSEQDKNIYHFTFDQNKSQGSWQKYDTSLPASLKVPSQEQATLAQGSDGSKVLELYDCSVKPNAVTRYVLLDDKGQAPPTGTEVGDMKSKRDLTLADWPDYNATAAPTFTRDGFSLARSDKGIVAMTGGNDDNPVSLFNEADNSWLDSTQFFNVKSNDQQPLMPTTTATPTSSPTSSPTSTPTDPSGAPDHKRTAVILGAVLGTILGLIILCILLLFLFKYRQRKQRQQMAAQAEEEKRRMSFADRGDPFMMDGGEKGVYHETGYPAGTGATGQTHHRHTSTRGSDSSTARLVPRKPVHPGEGDAMEMSPIGEHAHGLEEDRSRSPRASSIYPAAPKRSSGWSRYFSGNNATGTAGAAAGAAAASSLRRKSSSKSRGRYSEDAYSTYTTDSGQIVAPAELPPLKLGHQFNGERISRVVTGTPPTSPPGSSHRQTGAHSLYSNRDSRPRTAGSTISALSSAPSIPANDSFFSRLPPADNRSSWTTPATRSQPSLPKLRDEVPSSVYSRESEAHTAGRGSLNPIAENAPPKQSLTPLSPRTNNTATFLSTSSAAPIRDSNGPFNPPSPRTNGPASIATSSSSAPSTIVAVGSKSARVSDPDTWPRPPSVGNAAKPVNIMPPVPAMRAEPMDDFDDYDDEPVEVVSAIAAPTAVTAIPVPASTAMQYTVKRPSKNANTDMSWVNLNASNGR